MNWQPATPPSQLSDWIHTEDSLTERLRAAFGTIHVDIQHQGEGAAADHERTAIHAENGWVREVILRAQTTDRPLLWARTFIPALDADNPWAPLARIGAKPLGEVLFGLRDIEKGEIFAGKFCDPEIFRGTPCRWGRWRLWRRRGQPMMLTEVFLFHE